MRVGISLPVRELGGDLGAVRAFARRADELGLAHLRVPDLVIRPGGAELHEPLMLLAHLAAITTQIELVPSVVVAPSRQTVLLAKQAAELALVSDGRIRLGVGVGGSRVEYRAQGQDFATRGARLEEQVELMRRLWTEPSVTFTGRWDTVDQAGIGPRPQRSIPIWFGPGRIPVPAVLDRIGRLGDGWFVLCAPDELDPLLDRVLAAAERAGRPRSAIGLEASVPVVGDGSRNWSGRVGEWRDRGFTHLCLRTLGAGLDAAGHLDALERVARELA